MNREQFDYIREVVWPWTRDVVLFIAGLGLLVSESRRQGDIRLELLALYGAMMGLPLVLRADERGHRD